jgi:hypothetical protein
MHKITGVTIFTGTPHRKERLRLDAANAAFNGTKSG